LASELLVVDACSGLGGFSEAFLQRGHRVIRLDCNPKFSGVPNTLIADIRAIPLKRNLRPAVLLMAPDCTHFSVASVYRHWENGSPKHWGTVENLRQVFWCLDLVDYLNPRYWILENPRGMLRKVLGKPVHETFFASFGSLHLKPTDLWGEFPPGLVFPKPIKWNKAPRGSKSGTHGPQGRPLGCVQNGKDVRPSDSALRARIPYRLSEAICIAVESHPEI